MVAIKHLPECQHPGRHISHTVWVANSEVLWMWFQVQAAPIGQDLLHHVSQEHSPLGPE